MPSAERADQTCIIAVETRQRASNRKLSTGIVVDRVCEAQDITADRIEEAPSLDSRVDTRLILGTIGKRTESPQPTPKKAPRLPRS